MAYTGQNITNTTAMPPSINETEQTAAKVNIAINLNVGQGIDSVDTGYHTRVPEEQYHNKQSQYTRPLLPPVNTMRTATALPEPRTTDNWKEKYNEILNLFPRELKDLLLEEQMLSADLRLPSLLGIDNALVIVAKFLVWLEQAASPTHNSVGVAQNELNAALPQIVQKNIEECGSECIRYLREMLDEMGRNQTHYDDIKHQLDQLQEGLELFYELNLNEEGNEAS